MKKFVLLFLTFHLSLLTLCAQTEFYKRYAGQQGVRVASVNNFALDSASHLDVTLIEAIDDDGWAWMKREFMIGDLAPEQQSTLDAGSDVVLFSRRNRHNPSANAPIINEQIDAAGSCFMGISYLNRTVFVFCADDEAQYDALVTLLVKKIMHSSH
jgi:hypothetical protein